MPAQLLHPPDELAYTSPLGLAYPLLDVVVLHLSAASWENTVSLCSSMQSGKGLVAFEAASLVLLPIWTSPRVTLVHLFDDAIPLGLWVAG